MSGGLPDALALRLLAERYAMAVDRGDGALFAGQFTEDGELVAPRGTFRGHAALATVPGMMRRLYDRTHHSVTGMVPVIRDDGAEAETYTLARHFYRTGDGAEWCYEMTVRYHDLFRRLPDGWRLARRRLELVGETTAACGRLHGSGAKTGGAE